MSGEKQVSSDNDNVQAFRPGEKRKQTPSNALFTLRDGRPNISALISAVTKGAAQHERVVVGACGPEGMVKDARNAVAARVNVSGPSFDLHIESYGW